MYEKNIVDIKTEYTTLLTNILVPLLYEGILSTYIHSVNKYNEFIELEQNGHIVNNPGLTKIFQTCLNDIPNLSENAIDAETKRIRESCHCSDWFDDLVKAVIKSYIILLTFNTSGKTCKLVTDKYHERVSVNEFIHKCYNECATSFYNNPTIFDNCDADVSDAFKVTAYKLIKHAISDAIMKTLPIKLILHEYLSNDYIVPKPDNAIKQTNAPDLLESSISDSAPLDPSVGCNIAHQLKQLIADDRMKMSSHVKDHNNQNDQLIISNHTPIQQQLSQLQLPQQSQLPMQSQSQLPIQSQQLLQMPTQKTSHIDKQEVLSDKIMDDLSSKQPANEFNAHKSDQTNTRVLDKNMFAKVFGQSAQTQPTSSQKLSTRVIDSEVIRDDIVKMLNIGQ